MNYHLNSAPPVRTGWNLPPKGTRMRRLLLLALAPDGVSAAQAVSQRLAPNSLTLMTMMQRLEYETGYDIRRVGHPKAKRRAEQIYMVVGRHRWSGSYRRFRTVPDNLPNTRL